MTIKSKLQSRYNYYTNQMFYKLETSRLYHEISNNVSERTIYLFCNPTHSNLGDQAQTYCILEWLSENFPNFKVICAPKRLTPTSTLELIRSKIKPSDLIFVHSGYLIFDPHPELSYICDVVTLFNDRQIVILPQTVNLMEESVVSKVKKAFNNHSKLVLLCRDDISYSNAQTLFPNCRLILWPDMVTLLIGTRSYNNKREGILFCLRNDGEKFYPDDELNALKKKFDGVKNTTSDTTILKNAYAWKFSREKLLNEVLEDFSKYKLVITDRYHGTIFSQIASTPVIILSSSDHKLSSGAKWFPKEHFENNVFFAKNLDEAYEIGKRILLRNGKITISPPYFRQEYFSKLKSILEL